MRRRFFIFGFFCFFVIIQADDSFGELLFVKDCDNIAGFSNQNMNIAKGLASRLTPLPLPLSSEMPLLFRYFPVLCEKIPYVSLGEFPSDVQKIPDLGEEFSTSNVLYIKRDDSCGERHIGCSYEICPHLRFGGGKVRKLEFVLADALHHRAKTVLAISTLGSNHAPATRFYAHRIGLGSILIFENEEIITSIARRNLLICRFYEDNIHLCYDKNSLNSILFGSFFKHKLLYGDFPYIIPEYGSSVLDFIGFVNAAFELREQIEAGDVPIPDAIYIPLGTMRSVAGLVFGLKVAQLNIKVCAIKVRENSSFSKKQLINLTNEANDIFKKYDSIFDMGEFSSSDVEVIKYPSNITSDDLQSFKEAMSIFGVHGQPVFDEGYSFRAFVTFLLDAKNVDNKNLLFWDTYYDNDFSSVNSAVDFKLLPREFHHFFQE